MIRNTSVIRRKAAFLSGLVVCLLAGCGNGSADWDRLPDQLQGGIAVYGDSRTGHSVHALIAEGIASVRPAAVVHTGDLVEDGNDPEDWATFDRIVSVIPTGTPFYPALGNHERESALYFERFALPSNERWYSIRLGPVHLVVLDTQSDLSEGSEQRQWLEADLTASAASTFTAVAFHYPPYNAGKHGEDDKGLQQSIVPLFRQYGVDVVFSGHDHNYQRSTVDGIRYVITGGGGAPLYGQTRTPAYNEVFSKSYHFCVLWTDAEGKLSVDVWDWRAQLVDRFEVVGR